MGIFSKRFLATLLTEFLGLFFLIFVVAGSVICMQNQLGHNFMSIVLTVGFTAAPLSKAFGPISFQVNPAITFMFFWRQKIQLFEAILIIGAQCAGSSTAIFLLKDVLLTTLIKGTFGVPSIHKDLSPSQGLVIELILSFMLILIILFVTERERPQVDSAVTSLYVSMATMACKFFAIPITGGVFNPAVAFGSTYMHGLLSNSHFYIYWLGPILGGIFASIFYDFLKYLTKIPMIQPIPVDDSKKAKKKKNL